MLILKPVARKDIDHWERANKSKYQKIQELIHSIKLNPKEGIGKPHRLKGYDAETWSRRIDEEHRLVYEVYEDRIIILSARHHYK
jgi:toxin YoeB